MIEEETHTHSLRNGLSKNTDLYLREKNINIPHRLRNKIKSKIKKR